MSWILPNYIYKNSTCKEYYIKEDYYIQWPEKYNIFKHQTSIHYWISLQDDFLPFHWIDFKFYFFDSKREIIQIFDIFVCNCICIDSGSTNFVDFSSCGNSLISLIQPGKVLSKLLRTIFIIYLKILSQVELSDSLGDI